MTETLRYHHDGAMQACEKQAVTNGVKHKLRVVPKSWLSSVDEVAAYKSLCNGRRDSMLGNPRALTMCQSGSVTVTQENHCLGSSISGNTSLQHTSIACAATVSRRCPCLSPLLA